MTTRKQAGRESGKALQTGYSEATTGIEPVERSCGGARSETRRLQGKDTAVADGIRTTKPFLCQACFVRSAAPHQHPSLGWVCPACLRPLVPVKGRRRRHGGSGGRLVVSRVGVALIARRDGWVCQLCGEPVDPIGPWEHRPSVDHIVRRRDGGRRDPGNLRLAHQSCNEYREGANRQPFAPPLEAA